MGLIATTPQILNGAKAVNGLVQNTVGTGQAQNQINPYLAQQTALASQIQGVANGTGPNPALAQLNQTTQKTGQQAASTLSAQRGMNSGLAARTASQEQVGAQQEAAGQAATMEANQQLGALGQLNNVYSSQEGASNTAQQTAAGIGGGNQKATGQLIGGLTNAGGGIAEAAMAEGGTVGDTSSFIPNFGGADAPDNSKAQSSIGKYLGGMGSSGASSSPTPAGGGQNMMAKGGKVSVIVSPGEGYLPPSKAKSVAKGHADPIKTLHKFPGKAKVPGDSLKNDVLPKKLEEGGIVIPRSVMQSRNPHWAAKKFVEAHLGMQSKKRTK